MGLFITLQNPDRNSKMTRPYIFITIPAYGDNMVVPEARSPWLPSQTDMFCKDWVEAE